MGIDAEKLLLLAFLALLLFGPRRLPEIARQAGRAWAELRRLGRQFEHEVREVTEPFRRELEESAWLLDPRAESAERAAADRIPMDPDHSRFLGPPARPVEEAPPPQDASP